jgi:hypothetical protein
MIGQRVPLHARAPVGDVDEPVSTREGRDGDAR